MSGRKFKKNKNKQRNHNRQNQAVQEVLKPVGESFQELVKEQPFDLSAINAASILPRDFEKLEIYMVGCGGTGGFMALFLSRLAKCFHDSGKGVHLCFVDDDIVKDENLSRQHFSYAEVGMNKAETLARRYGHAFGINTSAFPEKFSRQMFYNRADLTVLVGCVDNAEARKEINEVLNINLDTLGLEPPSAWYLDCGNGDTDGQVTLGSSTVNELFGSFPDTRICTALPSPMIQHPSLLIPRPEEKATVNMSCAEMMIANMQGLNINAAIALQAVEMLFKFLVTKTLDYHRVDVSLSPPVTQPTFTTIDEISRITRKSVDFLRGTETKAQAA